MLMMAVLGAIGAFGAQDVSAHGVYALNPVVVTAQRMEKTELKTPVTETIVSQKKIKEAGYKNAFDIIEHQVGLSSTGYGDAGADFGFSSGRTVIRGYDRGTLVMVNGIPLNLKNYNSLEGIPVDMIKKVEIIKGASGTLYGAEAMGGVINILTKTNGMQRPHGKVTGTYGNYFRSVGANYSNKDFIISATREYIGALDEANDYPDWSKIDWNNGSGTRNKFFVSARVSHELTANLMYQNGSITRWGASNPKKYNYIHEDSRINGGLYYHSKETGLRATLGYNYRGVDGKDFSKPGDKLASAADLSSYIFDVQKDWSYGKDTLITGYTWKQEKYKGLYNSYEGHRNNNALYLSYHHPFTEKFSTTIGLRGEWIDDVLNNQSVITPQFQSLYEIDDSTSWYVNIGKAFQMPTVDDELKYSQVTNLKPERGWTYETGIKKIIDDRSTVKVSLYHMNFENKIGWKMLVPDDTSTYVAYNKGNFRNTGMELEYETEVNDNWSCSFGIGVGNPEFKDPSQKGAKWTQDSAKTDVVGTLSYHDEKLVSTLSYKYLGNREMYKGRQVPAKSRVTWNTLYKVSQEDTLTFTINNLFNHKNYANKYGNLELPRNYRLTWSHLF